MLEKGVINATLIARDSIIFKRANSITREEGYWWPVKNKGWHIGTHHGDNHILQGSGR